jgi:RNA polymerase sigma-70 factor (ECF subfamily)
MSNASASKSEKGASQGAGSRSDATLIAAVRSGDMRAFRELVERYQRRVYAVAMRYCKNGDDAMDRTQEAFVKAYQNLERFQGTSGFYTWLYRITTNVCLDFLRREKRHSGHADYDDQRDQVSGDDSMPTMGSGPGVAPDRAYQNLELGEQMKAALETLSPDHRSILILREVDGLSYDEIAEELDIPRGTVMSRLHHARAKMKEALSGYLEE